MGFRYDEVMVHACGLTDRGRVRPANEDAFVVSDLTADDDPTLPAVGIPVRERGVLVAVSDGMGGAQAGEVASALVIDSLKEHLGDDCKWSEIRTSMRCAVERANLDVWEAARQAGRERGAESTAKGSLSALMGASSLGGSKTERRRGWSRIGSRSNSGVGAARAGAREGAARIGSSSSDHS